MKDKEKILKAFDYLERGKNKIDKERFQESCNILNKYILDVYKEDIITEKEADIFLERLTKLMTGQRKTEGYIRERKTKICPNCGAKIDAKAEICPNCGVRVKPIPVYIEKKSSGIAAVLSFLFTGLGQLQWSNWQRYSIYDNRIYFGRNNAHTYRFYSVFYILDIQHLRCLFYC